MTSKKLNATKSNINDNISSFAKYENLGRVLGDRHFGHNANLLTQNMLSSVNYDIRLCNIVVDSFKAQAKMNIKRNIISSDLGKGIIDNLAKIKKGISENKIKITQGSIYDVIEKQLVDAIGDKAFDFRIAKSRQDQIAGDVRLWVRSAYDTFDNALHDLHNALINKAEENVKTIIPSFLHSQTAQPTSFAHHLMAYVSMFGRDRERMLQSRARVNQSPYGCVNGVGTSFNINRDMVARTLGFDSSCVNSIDAVCDRDFIIEFASTAALCATHIAKFVGEIIHWNSPLVSFISFSNDFNTVGSLIPDFNDSRVAELIRAKTCDIYATLSSLVTTVQSLNLSFSEDIATTTEKVFVIYDILLNSINLITALIADIKVNRKNMKEAAYSNYSTANDIVEWLVINANLSLIQAEKVTKQIIEFSIVKGKKLSLLELKELQDIESKITNDIYSVLIPSRAIITRRSNGGSNPVQIRKAIRVARRKYL